MTHENIIKRLKNLLRESNQNSLERQKLFSIAKKLNGILPKSENPTETFLSLSRLGTMQSEYLSKFGLENVIKISLIIYFKRKGVDEDKINKILDSLYYAILFETEGNLHNEDCSECEGSGYIRCEECYGSGTEECGECDGNGEVECSECEGQGKIEDGDGDMIDCDNCSGRGEIDCDYCAGGSSECRSCSGNGEADCSECDGTGTVETEKKDFYISGICSWDQNLKNILELREQEYRPALDSISNFEKKIINLNMEEGDEFLPDDIVENKLYCVSISDNSNMLHLKSNLTVSVYPPNQYLNFIINKP